MSTRIILLVMVTLVSTATITIVQHCSTTTQITIPIPSSPLHTATI